MATLRWLVLLPVIDTALPGFYHLSHLEFLLLAVDVVIVTVGGYIINDLYDQQTDAHNQKAGAAIGKWITEATAWKIYIALGLAGFCLSALLAVKISYLHYLILYPSAWMLLWIYASFLKSSILWGNLVVASFTAFVPLLVLLAEWPAVIALSSVSPAMANWLVLLFAFFSGFAFLLNLAREIVKDMEDMEGDKRTGITTMPVVFGIRKSALTAGCTLSLAVLSLALVMSYSHLWAAFDVPSILGMLLMAILTVCLAQSLLFHAPASYRKTSILLKICMLIGLFFLSTLAMRGNF